MLQNALVLSLLLQQLLQQPGGITHSQLLNSPAPPTEPPRPPSPHPDQRGSPVGLQLHPAQLHAHRALGAVGLVRDGGAERADPGRGHRIVLSGGRGGAALAGRVSVRLVVVVVVVLLLRRVALRRQTEVRPQLWGGGGGSTGSICY